MNDLLLKNNKGKITNVYPKEKKSVITIHRIVNILLHKNIQITT